MSATMVAFSGLMTEGLVLEEWRRIDADPGTHRGSKGDSFNKGALGGRGSGLDHRLNDGAAVLHQGVVSK